MSDASATDRRETAPEAEETTATAEEDTATEGEQATSNLDNPYWQRWIARGWQGQA
jgi:hypothetical protein